VSIVAKRLDQDGTWHGGGPRSRPHCARWGPSSLPKKGTEPPIFCPFLSWLNGWMHQDVTWYGGRPRPTPHMGTRLSPPPPAKKGTQPLICSPCLLWPNGWIKTPALGTEADRGPGHIVLDGDPALPCERGTVAPSLFLAHVYYGYCSALVWLGYATLRYKFDQLTDAFRTGLCCNAPKRTNWFSHAEDMNTGQSNVRSGLVFWPTQYMPMPRRPTLAHL